MYTPKFMLCWHIETLTSQLHSTHHIPSRLFACLKMVSIDVPGWGDTDGNIQDAVNLSTISKFTQQHPHLSCKCLSTFPNIVLIVISAVDKRLGGERSNCAHMLKAVSKLRIVDRVHRNVVFVLTHANAIPKGRYKDTKFTKTKEVQALSRQYLGVLSPVVWIENDINGNLLDVQGVREGV